MAAQVISLAQRMRAPASRDWSRQELAEFYRVESALLQAGLELETERGLSDEGDPWFVFCRADTGEVFIHFARSDGWYVVDGAAMGTPSRGRDFGALVRDLISRHPLSNVRRPGSNVLMHPAALLIALVGAAFFHSGRAKAAEVASHDGAPAGDARDGRRGLTLNGGVAPAAAIGEGGRVVALDASEVAAVLTGVAIGLRQLAEASAADAAPAATDPLAAPSSFSLPALRDLASRGDRGASADMIGGLAAADARAALTVMAVVHDLAPGASAAGSSAGAGATPTSVVTADISVRVEGATPAAAPPPSGSEAGALLLVHLAPGPLPLIEALAVVAADGALARVSLDRVVHVDQLPTFLADLVSHGEIVPPAPDAGAPVKLADVSTAPVDHNPVQTAPVDDGQSHAGSAKVPTADAHAGEVTAAPAPTTQPAPAPSVAETPSPPVVTSPVLTPFSQADHPAPPHSAVLDAAVLAFVTAVTNVQVVVSGHEVVFYDPKIFSVLSPGDTLDSITWRLDDGSSVSLVGTAAELHTFHGLG